MTESRIWNQRLTTALLLVIILINSVRGTILSLTVSNGLGQMFIDEEQIDFLPNHGNWLMADHYVFPEDYVRLIAIRAFNVNGGCSGILAHLRNSTLGYDQVSDRQWKCSAAGEDNWQYFGFDDSRWPDAHEVGLNGVVS